jgi:cytochrome b561
MAHGRTFFPDHLLGRGITAMNVLFIGGAGILQPISGAYMNAMLGEPPAIAFARLHISFGVLLLLALAVYVFSREPKSGKA